MNISHYCYTRGHEFDYGNFSFPNSLDENSLDELRSKVFSILNSIERDLNLPKWVLIKKRNTIIWGVCCYNKMLCKTLYKDCKGRPIRGFFALVLTDINRSDLRVPFDLSYFKKLYEYEVEKYWYELTSHENSTTDFLEGNYPFVSAYPNEYVDYLNTNSSYCKSLGKLDKVKTLAAALTHDTISLVMDNDNIEQANNPMGSFMNCLSDKLGPSINIIPSTKSNSDNYDQTNKELRTIIPDKKAVDPVVENVKQIAVENINQLTRTINKIQHNIITTRSIFIAILLILSLAIMHLYYNFYFNTEAVVQSATSPQMTTETRYIHAGENVINIKVDPHSIMDKINVNWITIKEQNDENISLRVALNDTPGERQADITIHGHDGESRIIRIVQNSSNKSPRYDND